MSMGASRGPGGAGSWEPPSTLSETIKRRLVPPRLYYAVRAWRERWRGEAEIALLEGLVPGNRNAVDAGAAKGVYTYWLSKYARHVHAFEPNPKIYRVLEAGVGKNVTAYRVALSERTGRATFRVPRSASGYSNQRGTLSARSAGASFGETEVETKALDDLGLSDIGFMKIDVEGHERAVLAGARETIRRDRPTLLIEIEESHTGVAIESALAEVTELGYTCQFLLDGALRGLDAFDPERHHRHARLHDRPNYIFNFIFVPKSGEEAAE